MRVASRSRALWLLLVVPTCASWAQDVQYAVDDKTEIRRSPDPQSEVIGTLARGDEVRLRGSQGVWRRVSAAHVSAPGWVPSWRISASAPAKGSSTSVLAVTSDVNIRLEPSADAGLLAIVSEGTGLTVLESRGEWRLVRIAGSKLTGWAPAWALHPGEAPPTGQVAAEITVAPDRGQMRYVNGENVYLRKGPSIETEPAAILAKTTVVYPIDVAGEWVRVRVHEGPEGWICRIYLSEKPDLAPGGSYLVGPEPASRPEIRQSSDELGDNEGMIYQDTAGVHSGPSDQFPVVATMPAGVVFRVVGESNGWYRAHFPDGTDGWVASWLCVANRMPEDLPAAFQEIPVQPAPQPAAVPQGSEIGNYLARLAMSQVGKPYIWGAESPTHGFDCSGLLYWAHGQLGIKLPRVTYDQFRVGRKVAPQELVPGDCVYFGWNRYMDGPGHCGMYIGNGWFIHAPGRGKRVRYQPLQERAKDFCGARRMY